MSEPLSNRPADEAAVWRSIRPSPTRIYSSAAYGIVLTELDDDGLCEDVCDAIAEDPRAVRALLRRAKELGEMEWFDKPIPNSQKFVNEFAERHGHAPWIICGDPDYGCLLDQPETEVSE